MIDTRSILSTQNMELENLKMKLATIEDSYQVALLHVNDNEHSLAFLEKQKTSNVEKVITLNKDISMIKSLCEENEEQVQERNEEMKNKKTTAVTHKNVSIPFPLPQMEEVQHLNEFLHKLMTEINSYEPNKKQQPLLESSSSSSSSSSSPSAIELKSSQVFQSPFLSSSKFPTSSSSIPFVLPFPSNPSSSSSLYPSESYFQMISDRMKWIYQNDFEKEQKKTKHFEEKIVSLQKKIKETEFETEQLSIHSIEVQRRKDQLLSSRNSLLKLLQQSKLILEQNSRKLINDVSSESNICLCFFLFTYISLIDESIRRRNPTLRERKDGPTAIVVFTE
jgi:chromosome segregation ATPase